MPQKKTELHKLLGLARRAGKLEIGRGAVFNAIKKGKAQIIIITEDASIKIYREIEHQEKKLRVLKFGRKDRLGEILGRTEVAVLAVCDSQFAKAFIKIMAVNHISV